MTSRVLLVVGLVAMLVGFADTGTAWAQPVGTGHYVFVNGSSFGEPNHAYICVATSDTTIDPEALPPDGEATECLLTGKEIPAELGRRIHVELPWTMQVFARNAVARVDGTGTVTSDIEGADSGQFYRDAQLLRVRAGGSGMIVAGPRNGSLDPLRFKGSQNIPVRTQIGFFSVDIQLDASTTNSATAHIEANPMVQLRVQLNGRCPF